MSVLTMAMAGRIRATPHYGFRFISLGNFAERERKIFAGRGTAATNGHEEANGYS